MGLVTEWQAARPHRASRPSPDSTRRRRRVFMREQLRLAACRSCCRHALRICYGVHGAHGAALVEGQATGFATSGNDSSVVTFDGTSFALTGKIPAAEDADAIIYDPVSRHVFSFNGDAHNATVIDPAGRLVTNVALGGKPESGVTAGNGKVYVNLVDNGEVVEIDGATLAVTRRWPTTGCRQPV